MVCSITQHSRNRQEPDSLPATPAFSQRSKPQAACSPETRRPLKACSARTSPRADYSLGPSNRQWVLRPPLEDYSPNRTRLVVASTVQARPHSRPAVSSTTLPARPSPLAWAYSPSLRSSLPTQQAAEASSAIPLSQRLVPACSPRRPSRHPCKRKRRRACPQVVAASSQARQRRLVPVRLS